MPRCAITPNNFKVSVGNAVKFVSDLNVCYGSPLPPYSGYWANLELLLPGGGGIAALMTEEDILEAFDFLKTTLLKWRIPLPLLFHWSKEVIRLSLIAMG